MEVSGEKRGFALVWVGDGTVEILRLPQDDIVSGGMKNDECGHQRQDG